MTLMDYVKRKRKRKERVSIVTSAIKGFKDYMRIYKKKTKIKTSKFRFQVKNERVRNEMFWTMFCRVHLKKEMELL